MELDITSLLGEALRGIAFYRDTHTLKALFAIERLWNRYPHWPKALQERALHFQESIRNTTRVEALVHQQISSPLEKIPERRWRQNVEMGLFPIAYASIVDWHKAEGIESIVSSYQDWAVATIGDLGHSWTIWCSFYEALPHLDTEILRLYTAERFAEFVAQQFHKDGRTLAQSATRSCSDMEGIESGPGPVLSEALRRPGFLGHHLLTLGTLLRHRALLSPHEFAVGLLQTRSMIRFQWNDPAFDVVIPDTQWQSSVGVDVLEERLIALLTNGIDNVHTLTLADVAVTLWDHSDPSQRAQLCRYLARAAGEG
jgi:hypothetical protein